MSRKNKSNFGIGATGAISFPSAPAASAPTASAPTPSDYGPMRIAPPKKFLALGRVKAAAPKPVIPRAVGPTVSATHKSLIDAVAIVAKGPGDTKKESVSGAAQAASDMVSKSPGDTKKESVSGAAQAASDMVSASYNPERHGTTGGGVTGATGGGGGGGDEQYKPESQQTEPAQYQDQAQPQYQDQAQPEKSEAWTLPIAKASTAMVLAKPVPVLDSSLPKKGIFTRIWEFFFGGSTEKTATPLPPVATSAPVKVAGELEDAAESLVKRARYGDQNAMAILDLIGKNAKKGVPAAIKSRALIAAYIKRNPIIGAEPSVRLMDEVQMNGEASVRRAATHIANGQPVTHSSVMGTLASFCSEQEKGAFLHGMSHPKQPSPSAYGSKIELAHRAGKAIALAGKIQNVKKPGSYITAFDPVVGWELGE